MIKRLYNPWILTPFLALLTLKIRLILLKPVFELLFKLLISVMVFVHLPLCVPLSSLFLLLRKFMAFTLIWKVMHFLTLTCGLSTSISFWSLRLLILLIQLLLTAAVFLLFPLCLLIVSAI